MNEWFDKPGADGEAGLRFACTMCGNCCTGPEGFVLVSDSELAALARRVGLAPAEFERTYCHATVRGRSLTERATEHGMDCVFLDRASVPGKAVCGVYEDRPAQCRTWPFWRSNLTSRDAWRRAKQICPGMDRGERRTPQQVRVLRGVVDI
jgi:hypothetical protein